MRKRRRRRFRIPSVIQLTGIFAGLEAFSAWCIQRQLQGILPYLDPERVSGIYLVSAFLTALTFLGAWRAGWFSHDKKE